VDVSCKTLVGLFGILLSCTTLSFGDSLVYTLNGISADEQHSYRNTVSLGEELISEQEHIDYSSGDHVDRSFNYSIPDGFIVRGATIDFALSGYLSTVTSASSTPVPGFEADYVPANILPRVENDGPMYLVTIGDQWFYLSPYGETNAATSFDLFALGYSDLVRQGTLITFIEVMTMFSYQAANGPQWWGRNAIGTFSVDQYWSADYDVTLTLDIDPLPEPGTVFLLGSGLLALGVRRVRTRSQT
jgi:hypothetical protein